MQPPSTVPATLLDSAPLSWINSPPRRCHCCLFLLCVCFFFFLRNCPPHARGVVVWSTLVIDVARRCGVCAGLVPPSCSSCGRRVCACLAFSFFSFLPPHSSPRLGFTPTQCALGVASLWGAGRSWRLRCGRARSPLWCAPVWVCGRAGRRRRWRRLRTVL